ncbi:hypothetical protein P9869_33000 [Streptomyces ossamyceticus]|nr:hypothetical protein [Streptomyces ossamyceticus]
MSTANSPAGTADRPALRDRADLIVGTDLPADAGLSAGTDLLGRTHPRGPTARPS